MVPPSAKRRSLSTADARREEVLQAATAVFAARGIHGTPTLEVARAAGISQAYLFRLFPTKEDLAIALVERCNARIEAAFQAAAARATAAGEEVLPAMGTAYVELLADRDLLLMQLHAHAAAVTVPAIRDAMRASFDRLFALVQRESGEDEARIGRFFQMGMALNVAGALDALELDAPWARALCTKGDEDGDGA
jgi:AcrR family transcriptional regulator